MGTSGGLISVCITSVCLTEYGEDIQAEDNTFTLYF